MIRLRMEPGSDSAGALTGIKLLAHRHPGSEVLAIEAGERTLELGLPWRFAPTQDCLDSLALFGEVEFVVDHDGTQGAVPPTPQPRPAQEGLDGR